jgi:hypothetical protein
MGAHRGTLGPLCLLVAARQCREQPRGPPSAGAVRPGRWASSPRAASLAAVPSSAIPHAEVPFAAAIRACTPSPGGDFPCFSAFGSRRRREALCFRAQV